MKDITSYVTSLLSISSIELSDVSKFTGISKPTLTHYRNDPNSLQKATIGKLNLIVKYYESLNLDLSKPIEKRVVYQNVKPYNPENI